MNGRVFSLSRRFMGWGGGNRGGVCWLPGSPLGCVPRLLGHIAGGGTAARQLRRRRKITEGVSQCLGHPPAGLSMARAGPRPATPRHSPASSLCPCPALPVPSAASGCSLPSLAGNGLLKSFFPKLGVVGWLAVFSVEVPHSRAVPDVPAAWPGGTPALPREPAMGRAAPP